MDRNTWKDVINGWTPPMIIVDDESEFVKPEKDWTYAKNEVILGNSRTIIVIYNGVDKNIIRILDTYTNTKEACETF